MTMNSRDGDDGLLRARLLAAADGDAYDCYITRKPRFRTNFLSNNW